jgi:predicted amidohydrolase YtcJ
VTINAAWQGREDKTKGSIEVGKRADFLILSGNPLTVDALDLRSIKVVSTYKNGELVYDSREWVS